MSELSVTFNWIDALFSSCILDKLGYLYRCHIQKLKKSTRCVLLWDSLFIQAIGVDITLAILFIIWVALQPCTFKHLF